MLAAGASVEEHSRLRLKKKTFYVTPSVIFINVNWSSQHSAEFEAGRLRSGVSRRGSDIADAHATPLCTLS